MSPILRRSLLKAAAVAGAAAQFSWALGAKDAQAAPRAEAADADPVTLDWLEDGGLGAAPGSTVGVPWPKGAYQADQTFALTDADGKAVPVQSWPIAYWPDGSLKWSAHAVSSGSGKLTLAAGDAAAPAKKVTVDKSGGTIDVSTGVITAKIGKNGSTLIKSVTRGSTEIAKNGRLVLIRQPEIEDEDQGAVRTERFDGAIGEVTVEQDGPVRAVVRIDGKHRKEAGVGCRSPSGCTSTPVPTPSAWCTPSPTTAHRSRARRAATSSAGSGSASPCPCGTSRTTGTSGSAARAPVCCARP